MNQDVDNSTLLTRYLLGELSEGDEVNVEKRFFEDSDFLDELRSTERDLIDSYVRGELTGNVRVRFEQRFLTEPERRSRVMFAVALAKSISRSHSLPESDPAPETRKGHSAWILNVRSHARELLAAAAVVLISLFAWLNGVVWQQVTAPAVVEERAPNTDPGPTPPVAPPITPHEKATPRVSMPALVLNPGRLRDRGGARLVIPAGVKFVPVVLALRKSDYAEYRVVLQTPGGKTLWQIGRVKVDRRRHLQVRIPVGRLRKADYVVEVKGRNPSGPEEDVDNFYFEVIRR